MCVISADLLKGCGFILNQAVMQISWTLGDWGFIYHGCHGYGYGWYSFSLHNYYTMNCVCCTD